VNWSDVRISSVPGADEQEWCIEALAQLIKRRGVGGLVSNPVVLPTPGWFPDAYTPSAAGARRIALRLLRYAGLSKLDVRTELFQGEQPTFVDGQPRSKHTVAYFAGIVDGVCDFGIDQDRLNDPAAVVGALAHEVAHAFRAFHGLVIKDSRVEELLTDLTTVYLGFGVLTANVAYRFRVTQLSGGSRSEWGSMGYLGPQAMSFLLAAQLRAREMPSEEHKKLLSHLEPDQQSYLKASLAVLDENMDPIALRLGLPPRSDWPSPPATEVLQAPLARGSESPDELPASPKRRNKGNPVWALHESAPGLPIFGFLMGIVLAAAIPGAWGMVAWGACVALGMYMGRYWQKLTCTDTQCTMPLRKGEATCPGCGGTVMGVVGSQRERMELEERLEAEHAKKQADRFFEWRH
jgi:hypothetical protein